MDIRELIDQIVNNLSVKYFFAQFLTILCLYVYGYFYLTVLTEPKKEGKSDRYLKLFLSFPMGLAVYTLVAYLMVTFAIAYNPLTIIIACFLMAALTYGLMEIKEGRGICFDKIKAATINDGWIHALTIGLIVCAVAVVATLGIFSVTVSNDTMYNFSFYPRAIVHYGGLRVNFNTFLTDVGQGCALINTLPYLFGFNETFGIQHMLNFSFVGIFYIAVYENFEEHKSRTAHVFSAIITALLICSLPFLLLSKWVLANDYFAVYMFTVVYLAYRQSKITGWNIAIISVLVSALSIMRIEGGVYAALFILCISVFDYTSKELGLCMLLPVMVLHASYSARIFLTMDITDPYMFLTPSKATIMIVIMAAVLVYLFIFRGKILVKLFDKLEIVIIVGLVGLNALLFIKDPTVFITNVKAFIGNVIYNGGWGIAPAVAIATYIVCLFSEFKFGYWDFMSLSYLLYAFAVAFMRDDGLQLGAGDSGNRVLLQVVPLLIFSAASHLNNAIKNNEK